MLSQEPRTPFKQMQRFASITKACLKSQRFERARRFLLKAEELLKEGSPLMQTAVASTFLPSLTSQLNTSAGLRQEALKLMPPTLREEYRKQQVCWGI